MKKKTVNLVLSGGAARGLAHIGVISAIEKRFRIRSIVGTSMGSIVGGLYAYGYTVDELSDIARSLDSIEALKFFRLNVIRQGLVHTDNLLEFLKKITREVRIENLKIPYIAIAYDMITKKTVTIESGGLAEAMLASSSVPLFFKPLSYSGYLFYDGGLEYPLPIEFHDMQGKADLTIAVSCTPQLPGKPERFNPTDNAVRQDKDALEFAMDALGINQTFLTMRSLERVKPDIYIPDYDENLSVWDFGKVDQFVELGRKNAEEVLQAWEQHKPKDFLDQILKRSSNILGDIAELFR